MFMQQYANVRAEVQLLGIAKQIKDNLIFKVNDETQW